MTTLLGRINRELAGVSEKARRSLVQIGNGGRGAGAGTVWHPRGLVITNFHVVAGGPLRVTLSDGRTLQARLLGGDPALDVAALAIDGADLPTTDIGDSRLVKPGQLVMAVGHPLGIVGAVTAGVVIGTGSDWTGLPPAPQGWPPRPAVNREWITIGLNLRPGNSGGPLLDAEGRLVGINTMMTGPEIGMAVPVHVVKAFLQQTLGSQTAER